MKGKWSLIIAVIFGLVAAGLVKVYLDSLQKQYAKGEELVEVLVARAYIPKTTVVTPKLVKAVKIPSRYVQPRALYRKDDLLGTNHKAVYLTTTPIMENEQILTTKLTLPGKDVGLAVAVPRDKRAVAIPVTGVSGLGGLIKPGDYVDILATFDFVGGKSYTFTILQNILVLSCGAEILGAGKIAREKAGGEKGVLAGWQETGPSLITVALTSQEAVTATFAKQKGQLSLALRSAGDKEKVSVHAVSLETFAPGKRLSSPGSASLNPEEIRSIQEMFLKKH